MSAVIEKPNRTRIAKPAAEPTMTLGQATDKMWQLREEKRVLEAQVKALELQIKGDEDKKIIGLEGIIFGLLDAQDTRKAEGKKASVSIGESVVGNVVDWEAFWAWIAKTKNFHLIQKRTSDPGLRELWALKKATPGCQPFTKRTLSVRSL
jgi:hypothetical protein